MFFDCDPAREPPDRRLPRRALHVPQRVAGEALRNRGRHRAGVPARRADDARARRRAEPGQRARRFQLSDADVGRHSRQVHPAEHPRHAAPAAAAGRAAARRAGRGHRRVAAQADGECIGPTPSARRATRAWIRSASRSRTTMRSGNGGRWTATSRWIRAASCRTARRSRRRPRCARSSASAQSEFVAHADREAADLRPRPRPRTLRPPDRRRDHHATSSPPATDSRRSCARSSAACRSSRGAPRRRRPSSWPQGKSSRSMTPKRDCPADPRLDVSADSTVSLRTHDLSARTN